MFTSPDSKLFFRAALDQTNNIDISLLYAHIADVWRLNLLQHSWNSSCLNQIPELVFHCIISSMSKIPSFRIENTIIPIDNTKILHIHNTMKQTHFCLVVSVEPQEMNSTTQHIITIYIKPNDHVLDIMFILPHVIETENTVEGLLLLCNNLLIMAQH